MHIDPVVRKRRRALEHELNPDMVAVPKALGRSQDFGRRRRIELGHELAERRAGHEVIARNRLGRAILATVLDRDYTKAVMPDFGNVCLLEDLAAAVRDDAFHLFVELSRTETRIHELVDQRLDRLFVRLEHRVNDGCREGQALDALPRPIGANALARNPPNLLRIGLEEGVEKAPPEAIDDPIFERDDWRTYQHPPQPRGTVTGDDTNARQDAHTEQGVERCQRIIEIFALVIDACLPRDVDEIAAADVNEELLHLLVEREEAMRTDVEAVTAVLDRAGQTADPVQTLE